jgi:hypothetical protein
LASSERRRVVCGSEQLELRLWLAPGLRAGFIGSSGWLIPVLICSGPFAGMARIRNGSHGRELRFTELAPLLGHGLKSI